MMIRILGGFSDDTLYASEGNDILMPLIGGRSFIDLHSHGLLVNLMYADKNGHTDWQGAGSVFIDALFNDGVAWAFNGKNADVMLSKIAYTAIGRLRGAGYSTPQAVQ